MSVRIDWNKLSSLPDDIDKSFEKFCFHIAVYKIGEYGEVSYFYNTPGSEFYIELNKPLDYAGKHYSTGDVIGWQVKYWKGAKDEANSPLDANHIEELVDDLKKSLDYRPKIKLWIICSPGCFVQKQWDKLIRKLKVLKSDCSFESWHKDIFEHIYLEDFPKYNSVFQYFFGTRHIGKEQLDEISMDTLSLLERKYDVDLHTPTDFEQSLLSIVDVNIAQNCLSNKISSLYHHSLDDRKRPILNENQWGYQYLTNDYKSAYIKDLQCRYEIIDRLFSGLSEGKSFFQYSHEALSLIEEYIEQRKSRLVFLNRETKNVLRTIKDKENSIYYYLDELINRVNSLEEELTGKNNGRNEDVWYYLSLLNQKDISVFAEAGYGKTHFACSVANNMLKRQLPVLLLIGSQFRISNSCESKLIEILNLPKDTLIDDVLDELNFLGEVYGCRLPIIIDGLNESAPNEQRWKDELPPLRRKIRDRKYLLLITTCREKEEYIEVIYGYNNYTEVDNYIHLDGIAEKDLGYATERYFKKYDIRPTNRVDNNYFHNPLLLKIFCVTNQSRHDFELNDYSLASCMKNYSDKLVNMIASNNGRKSRIKRHEIECKLNKIAKLIWERNDRCLNFYNDFAFVFGEDTDKILDEGMCFLLDRAGNEELVQFSYDMVAGYHIAKYLLDESNDKNEFCHLIEENKEKLFGINRHTLAEDIKKSLFYLIPLKYFSEWFELMPNEEVIISSLDYLDIIICSHSGREALVALFQKEDVLSPFVKKKVCQSLYRRICKQSNPNYISIFIPFFINLNIRELDFYWNSLFSEYGVMEKVSSLLSDRYLAKRIALEDNAVLAALLCGITDTEYRQKYYTQLLYFIEQCNNGLSICQRLLAIKDPFIFESIISIITGVGLRSKDLPIVRQSITILEEYLINYTSNHIVLLDNLETLYSYGETVYGLTFDRRKLYKNHDEEWPKSDVKDFSFYSIYDYDYNKFNVRPLYWYSYKHIPHFSSDDIYGMLLTRIRELGYDECSYEHLQNKEDKETNYRRNKKCNYAHKYGRHALMELYGWMMMHSYIENKYKQTFRSSIIDIDPSHPKFSPLRSLVTKSYMPRNLDELPQWMETSNIEEMKHLFITKLPRKESNWILLRGYWTQNIEDRYVNLYLSGTSQLVPLELDDDKCANLDLDDATDHYHAFACELGWRQLEFTDEFDDDSLRPTLMAQYGFSSWDSERFRYKTFYCLNPLIAKRIGLIFDVKTMAYYLNEEKVSEYYVNDTDHFFYLRIDVVNKILKVYNAKIRHHVYERRVVKSRLPEEAPELLNSFLENEIDVFYTSTETNIRDTN